MDGKTLNSGIIDQIVANDPPRDVYIGSNSEVLPSDVAFLGRIDEVRIYNTAVSPLQTVQLRQALLPPPPVDTSAPVSSSEGTGTYSGTKETVVDVPTQDQLETDDPNYGSGASTYYFSVYSIVLVGLITAAFHTYPRA